MREGVERDGFVVFSNYQEMNFYNSLFALCAWHLSSTKNTPKPKKLLKFFIHFSFLLII